MVFWAVGTRGKKCTAGTYVKAREDLILLLRYLYFCLDFKSNFIVICEEQKVLGSVIGYCFEKERKLPFIFSPLALNPQWRFEGHSESRNCDRDFKAFPFD